MVQSIKIKRSSTTAVPTSLAEGELAYSSEGTSNKLFIGRPGSGSPGTVDVIGGKLYVGPYCWYSNSKQRRYCRWQ